MTSYYDLALSPHASILRYCPSIHDDLALLPVGTCRSCAISSCIDLVWSLQVSILRYCPPVHDDLALLLDLTILRVASCTDLALLVDLARSGLTGLANSILRYPDG
ncbi:Hypothetical protein NTJ_15820 [Nesidiocoris tenuis]|uniref:Uncharacterized protein n=1 Tax=Nesidiocoris tenuis TaxID=355587 RepID=A0ABN7BF53_9HEMI|nr:Hypothetical protein NTJ_15820 [Nesidiocoris tenuis]